MKKVDTHYTKTSISNNKIVGEKIVKGMLITTLQAFSKKYGYTLLEDNTYCKKTGKFLEVITFTEHKIENEGK